MNRVLKVIGYLFAVAIVAGGCYLGWQMWSLNQASEGGNAGGAKTVILGSLAPMVIDYSHRPAAPKTVAAEKQSSRAKYEERVKLVRTWQNATSLITALKSKNSRIKGPAVLSSADVPDVAPDIKHDAWGHPYCLFIETASVTALSAGEGQPFTDCPGMKLPANAFKLDGRLHFLETGSLLIAAQK